MQISLRDGAPLFYCSFTLTCAPRHGKICLTSNKSSVSRIAPGAGLFFFVTLYGFGEINSQGRRPLPEGALLLHLWIYLSFRPGSLNPLNRCLLKFCAHAHGLSCFAIGYMYTLTGTSPVPVVPFTSVHITNHTTHILSPISFPGGTAPAEVARQ